MWQTQRRRASWEEDRDYWELKEDRKDRVEIHYGVMLKLTVMNN